MDFNYAEMGKRIRNLRRDKGFTQEQLAELCDLSAAHIGHVERGTRTLSIDTLVKIAMVLETGADYLLFGTVADKDMPYEKITIAVGKYPQENIDRFYSVVKILSENIDRM